MRRWRGWRGRILTGCMLNQRGDVLLPALLLSGVVAAMAVVALELNRSSEQRLKVARVRSVMSVVEGRVRTLALQPAAYSGCVSTSGSTSCQLTASVWKTLELTRVFGAVCAPGVSVCGVVLQDLQFEAGLRNFRATVAYSGTDLSVAPSRLQITIPEEVLQSQTFDCFATDPTKPLFAGFDSSGRPICRSIVSCPTGTFVKAVDSATLQLACEPLRASAGCGITHSISRFTWLGGQDYHVQCQNRLDPFEVWGEP